MGEVEEETAADWKQEIDAAYYYSRHDVYSCRGFLLDIYMHNIYDNCNRKYQEHEFRMYDIFCQISQL